MILALAGGVGGAKLATGLAAVLSPSDLTIVVNTGDDFQHLGLHISPDLDTVMYNLAGIHNPEQGWGLAGETWHFMQALKTLGGEDWFLLGDRDLATHVERTRRLASGETLSGITQALCRRLGVAHTVTPMSDQPVRTIVHSDQGALAFQDYFVRLRCAPVIRRLEYAAALTATPSPTFEAALTHPQLRAIVLCPSNPFLSVAPMLAMPGMRERLGARAVPVIAVSPIVGGLALKGPAAKIFRELGTEPSVVEVARHYAGLITHLVIDTQDAPHADAITRLGMRVIITDTIMRSTDDKARLAQTILRGQAYTL